MSKSTVKWPNLWNGYLGITTYGEAAHSQKYADTGEQWCSCQNFNGKEIESISVAISAGTECSSIDLSIQGVSDNDTFYEAGLPDGVPITNSLISGVTGIGGSDGWATFTYAGTGPTPVGQYFIVVDPTASVGAYSFRPRYSADWVNGANWTYAKWSGLIGREWIHDGVDWYNNCTVGPVPMVIKYKDGTYASTDNNPPFSTLDVTFNANVGGGKSGGDVCAGVLFKAPYDLTLDGIWMKIYTLDYSTSFEVVLIEKDTDTVLYRKLAVNYWQQFTSGMCFFGMDGVSLTKDTEYRIYLVNPTGGIDDAPVSSITVPNTDYLAQMGIAAGDFRHCYADNPPSEGGAGTWTDSGDTEIGILQLKTKIDISSLNPEVVVTATRFSRTGQSGGTAF